MRTAAKAAAKPYDVRGNAMKTLSRRSLFGAAGCLACGGMHLGLTATPVQAQGWTPPAAAQRCPSRWGPNDRRGAMNLMTPERAKRAAGLIRTGEIVELGHVLAQDMPFFGTRRFDVHLKRTFMNPEANRRGSNEELVVAEIGQGRVEDRRGGCSLPVGCWRRFHPAPAVRADMAPFPVPARQTGRA